MLKFTAFLRQIALIAAWSTFIAWLVFMFLWAISGAFLAVSVLVKILPGL